MGTKPDDIPYDLVYVADGAFLEAFPAADTTRAITRSVITATIDWLREHPSETYRLLGPRRLPATSWDV